MHVDTADQILPMEIRSAPPAGLLAFLKPSPRKLHNMKSVALANSVVHLRLKCSKAHGACIATPELKIRRPEEIAILGIQGFQERIGIDRER